MWRPRKGTSLPERGNLAADQIGNLVVRRGLRAFFSQTSVRYMVAGLITIFALLFSSLDSISEANLTAHMFQHIGLFVGGISFGYGLEKFLIVRLVYLKTKAFPFWKVLVTTMHLNSKSKGLVFALAIPGLVFAFWHDPAYFDLAVTNPSVHVTEHVSYILVGSFAGLSIVALTRKWRMVLAYLAFMHAGMMGSIWELWPSYFPVYSPDQNVQMATTMMLFGAVGIVLLSSQLLRTLDII